MKRAACIALLTIAAFAASALAQTVSGTSGGSAGPATAAATTNGASAPVGSTGQAGVGVGQTNSATGSATMPVGDANISNQGLNPISSPSTLPGPTSTINNNGGFIGSGVFGAPLIETPSAALGGNASPSPVGASNATSGLQAGATNSTLQGPSPASSGAASATQFAGIFNTGAAEFTSDEGLGGKTLGQIAAENRQKKATQNVRVYTNQDLERLAQTPTTGFETNGVAGQGANSYMTGAQANGQGAAGATGGTMGAVSGATATPAQPSAPAVGAPATPPPAPKNQNNPPPPTVPR